MDALTPQRTLYYVKGISDGDKFSAFPIDVTFCGLEEVVTINTTAIDRMFLYNEEDQNYTIPYTNISEYFEFSFDPLLSHGECDATGEKVDATTYGYRLCASEDCTHAWTDFDKA